MDGWWSPTKLSLAALVNLYFCVELMIRKEGSLKYIKRKASLPGISGSKAFRLVADREDARIELPIKLGFMGDE